MKRQSRNHGFTLIEATIAMVLLAMAAAGVLLPFANAASVQTEGARQTLAANLATELMEYVLLKKDLMADPNDFIENWPVGYNGYSEADGAMLDTSDNLLTDSIYSGFSRSVVSEAVTVKSVPLVKITVWVAYEGNEMTRVTTLVGQ
jgi:prepilin-type N-terminal cleavage/methylation domain-containing protein